MPVKIILAGGGHAMLEFLSKANRLPPDQYHIILISESPYLYFSGMVPEFLGGVYAEEDIRINLEHLCRKSGVHFIKSRVIDIDRVQKLLITDDNKSYAYDMVAFDIGSITPHPDYLPDDTKAITVRPLHLLSRLRKRLLEGLQFRHLVIIGGGAAGVEMGLNISGEHHGAIRTEDFHISIYEKTERLLSEFPQNVSSYVSELLTGRGVNIYTGENVQFDRHGNIMAEHSEIRSADLIIWATGTHGPPVFSRGQLPVDSFGFLKVDQHLAVRDYPGIFAAGDCVTIDTYPGLAKIGIHAIKEGSVLAYNLFKAAGNLAKDKPIEFSSLKIFKPYPVSPLILSTGGREAVWTTRNFGFHSRGALRLKHLIDRRWINRYNSETHWNSLAEMMNHENAMENG